MTNITNISKQLAILEALLFVAGEPVPLVNLQHALEIEADRLQELLTTLNANYIEQERGLRIHQHNDTCQLVTAPVVASYVEKYLGLQTNARLSAAALEALTIIAYRQPLTRTAVEAVRGVDSSGVINTLLARGLIEEVGRAETIGHPVLFGTTIDFLHFFGLNSLSQLPPLQGLLPTETPAETTKPDTTTPSI
jgi:segregation and condensation protein B